MEELVPVGPLLKKNCVIKVELWYQFFSTTHLRYIRQNVGKARQIAI